jgi:hypothetical protein
MKGNGMSVHVKEIRTSGSGASFPRPTFSATFAAVTLF